MHWLKWKNGKEHGKIYCPMLHEWVETYLLDGGPSYNSYTAPFANEDGCVYFHKYDHDADCWHAELFYLGEHLEGIECTYEL